MYGNLLIFFYIYFLGDNQVLYNVNIDIDQSAVLVRDDCVSVKISLTSPLLRDQNESSGQPMDESVSNINNTAGMNSEDESTLLSRVPCLKVCRFFLLIFHIELDICKYQRIINTTI